MSSILFSVIIPTCNRNDTLAKCLDLIAPGIQTFSAEEYEVIVTDDGQTTTAQEMIHKQYPWVKWVAGPCKGAAANRNSGAKYAVGKWLVFTDDDCLPQPNWLQSYAEAITSSSLALEGSIYPTGDFSQDPIDAPENIDGGCFWSANIAILRSLFEEIGGFDINYITMCEDSDLRERILSLTTIAFIPEARVDHPLRLVNIADEIKRIPKRAIDLAYYMTKHKQNYVRNSLIGLVYFQFVHYLKWGLKELQNNKPKMASMCFATLIIGVPLIFSNLMLIKLRDFSDSKA
ncbi:MAG: glycosyltransferase family 2 protein [Scytonematopsis contorta HA4267-MV1]|nr:glycosyltransferase family 2 protein [Scytonematopsis contorta HA4267-MV1]